MPFLLHVSLAILEVWLLVKNRCCGIKRSDFCLQSEFQHKLARCLLKSYIVHDIYAAGGPSRKMIDLVSEYCRRLINLRDGAA